MASSSDDDDDDLFGGNESDDTNDLLEEAKTATSSSKNTAAARKEDSKSSNNKGGGLFDSDSEDEEDEQQPAAKSKKEKMQALSQKKRQQEAATRKKTGGPNKDKTAPATSTSNLFDDDDDDDNDSVDSAKIERTEEDDNFIDNTGVDEDDIAEYYAEQKFGSDDKKRKYRSDEAMEDNDVGPDDVPKNPVMAAVQRMQKKKRAKRSLLEQEDELRTFLAEMELAADNDERLIRETKPATHKMSMLSTVIDTMTQRDTQRLLIDMDLLAILKRWIQPLPNGTLGNVTLRQRILESIQKMSHGESGINNHDLKRSEIGKTVMVLYKHPKETPSNKKLLRSIIETWSRPIFQKSGNMRDLERVHQYRGPSVAVSAARGVAASQKDASNNDLGSLLSKGKQREEKGQRVRVPFSKGFAYSVRPEGRYDDSPTKQQQAGKTENRDKLSRRMLEKGRKVAKNQRSANISIEGRRTKG